MTFPSPSGTAVGETGDPDHVVTPDDPLTDPVPPAEDAGGDCPDGLEAPLPHAARSSAEAPTDDASSPLLSLIRIRVPIRTSGPYQRRIRRRRGPATRQRRPAPRQRTCRPIARMTGAVRVAGRGAARACERAGGQPGNGIP